MKTFNEIVGSDVAITSHMMAHEGGTKFYEVILIEALAHTGKSESALCFTRWGANGAITSGGQLGKGKILGKFSDRYVDSIIRNKQARGYGNPQLGNLTGVLAKRSLASRYDLFTFANTDPEAKKFFESLGLSAEAGKLVNPTEDEDLSEGETYTPPPAEPEVVRSPIFGSW